MQRKRHTPEEMIKKLQTAKETSAGATTTSLNFLPPPHRAALRR